jgi:hypothetical protein
MKMFEYKSEVANLPLHIIKSGIKPEGVDKFDNLLNQRAAEGWELVATSLVMDVTTNMVLLTFKKEKL